VHGETKKLCGGIDRIILHGFFGNTFSTWEYYDNLRQSWGEGEKMTPHCRGLLYYSHVDLISCSEKSVHTSTIYSHVGENGSSCLCGDRERLHASSRRRAAGMLTIHHKKQSLSSLVQVDFLQQQQQGKSQSPWDASEAIIES